MRRNAINYRIIGDEREREFLALVKLSRQTAELPSVRDPSHHLDNGQIHVDRKRFDFAWERNMVLLELDGGQWVKGGGRHNRDADKWKTLAAQAEGWTVLHISYTMLKADPARVLQYLAAVLERREER